MRLGEVAEEMHYTAWKLMLCGGEYLIPVNNSYISEASKDTALLMGCISLKNWDGLFLQRSSAPRIKVLGAQRYLHSPRECSWEKVKQQIEILAQY